MSRLESDIVKRGHECATLDSSPNAVGFYVKLGYTPAGPLNDDGAVPMRKALEIRIRVAAAGDEAILASLGAVVQDLHVGQRPDVFKPTDRRGLEDWFLNTLNVASAKIWIAELGDLPVGYALVIPQRRSENVFCHARRWYEVDQIGVHPEYRRHGVARRLLRHVVEAARADGVPDVELNTWTFNDVARTSFERFGFVSKNVRLERRTDLHGDHDEA
jgi:GNAT superfamily N-acetyltransferase